MGDWLTWIVAPSLERLRFGERDCGVGCMSEEGRLGMWTCAVRWYVVGPVAEEEGSRLGVSCSCSIGRALWACIVYDACGFGRGAVGGPGAHEPGCA